MEPPVQQSTEDEPLPTRWEIELEFVQSLANLQYLNYLAQNRFLEDEKFLSYLNYLEYWRSPEYARFLIYPNCLHVLTLLQNKDFRSQVLRQDIVGVLMNDMNARWREDLTPPQVVANGDDTNNNNNSNTNNSVKDENNVGITDAVKTEQFDNQEVKV